MSIAPRYGDISVGLEEYLGIVEIHRPPHNYFDHELIHDLADAVAALDLEPACRVGARF
jgi:enoyl-CoA hydratase/carnithine racemase